MESNVYKGSKTDFSYFVTMTLQNRMPWKMLSSILFNLAPTLNETREIVSILLKELETLQSTLQKKEKDLAKYQNCGTITKTQKSNIEHQKNILETETTGDIQENETIEDEVEFLKIVKQSMQEEMYVNMNEDTTLSDKPVNNENDESGDADDSIGEIDNEWYTFVKNAKTSIPKTEVPVQEKEFCIENEPSNENEDDIHVTEENEHDVEYSAKEIDNENYTFVANDKKQDLKTDIRLESKEIVVKQAKKRPYQCTFCQKAFLKSNHLKNHERIHTGEVPFECRTCSKRFKTKGNLKQHERNHTGEVPYECKTCKKKFKYQSALKIHERNHTGEEPYECKRCGQRFKQSSALKYHEKHHK